MKYATFILLLFVSHHIYADITDIYHELERDYTDVEVIISETYGKLSQSEMKLLKKHALQGDAKAQYHLAWLYDEGDKYLQKDHKEAVKWFKKSAEQGFARAQRALAFKYKYGNGVRENDKESLKWLRKSAEQDDSVAQAWLGGRYEDGDGVPKDKETAKEWYGKSCDNGFQEGCNKYSELNKKEEKCCIFW